MVMVTMTIDYMYIIIQAVNGDGNHDIDYMYIIIQAVNGDGNHDHWLHVYCYTGSQWWW